MADGRVSFSVKVVVRGYHAYKDIWAAVHCEELSCERETGNRIDAFAVAVMKDGMVVGHIPKKISSVLISFWAHFQLRLSKVRVVCMRTTW